jgi:hypothetical protein
MPMDLKQVGVPEMSKPKRVQLEVNEFAGGSFHLAQCAKLKRVIEQSFCVETRATPPDDRS